MASTSAQQNKLKAFCSRAFSVFVICCLLIRLASSAAASDCAAAEYNFSVYGFNTLFKRYDKSIVLINCGAELPDAKSIGTGFLVDTVDALFLTARHVVIDEDHNIDCTKDRMVAYVLGDMCEHVDLEYVDSDPSLDVALLRAKRQTGKPNNFSARQHLELLTVGMTAPEGLEGLGFGQFAATLLLDQMREYRKGLPGAAGGHECQGEPQPYKAQPLDFPNQTIQEHGPKFIRANGATASRGDSGAPVFLSDGRVAGIVTEVGIQMGGLNAGTKVAPSSDIVRWLVQILGAKKELNSTFSLEKWTLDENIFVALNPFQCSPPSCIPNVWIAAELQKIRSKQITIDKYTKHQLDRLKCPIYSAAKARLINPQSSFLQVALSDLGIIVEAERGSLWTDHAIAMLGSSQYTTYSKIGALNIAEESLANDLDAAWKKDPFVVAGTLCRSGLGTADTEAIQSQLNSYLKSFKSGITFEEHTPSAYCPIYYEGPHLKEVQNIVAQISNVKIQQEMVVKKAGVTPASSSIWAPALSALANSGDALGANALIELGDQLVGADPKKAASAYAKAYTFKPSKKAVTGFDYAITRLEGTKYGSKEVKIDHYVASFAPALDANSMTSIITSSGMKRGVEVMY